MTRQIQKGVGQVPLRLLSRFSTATLSTRLFLLARWYLTPYSQMTSHLPLQGDILDLGCGHGLFALAAVLQNPNRQVIGLDHDADRIRLASKATEDLPQIRLKQGIFDDFKAFPLPYVGVSMIDVLHYFKPEDQENILKQAYELLATGGVLLVREVEPHSGMISSWNRWYEKSRPVLASRRQKKKTFTSALSWPGVSSCKKSALRSLGNIAVVWFLRIFSLSVKNLKSNPNSVAPLSESITPAPKTALARFRSLTIGMSFLLALITLPLYALKVAEKTDYTDFSVYYRAALRMKLGNWNQIYSLQDGASPFRYSPIFLPFFGPSLSWDCPLPSSFGIFSSLGVLVWDFT